MLFRARSSQWWGVIAIGLSCAIACGDDDAPPKRQRDAAADSGEDRERDAAVADSGSDPAADSGSDDDAGRDPRCEEGWKYAPVELRGERVLPPAATPAGGGGPGSTRYELTGKITAIASGDANPGSGLVPELSDSLQVESDGASYTLVAPDVTQFTRGLSVGETVRLEYVQPTTGVYAVRDQQARIYRGDDLMFQFVENSFSKIALPEGYAVDWGDEVCATEESCGRISRHALNLSTPNGQVAVAPSHTHEAGPYTFGVFRATKLGRCGDLNTRSIAVFLTRAASN